MIHLWHKQSDITHPNSLTITPGIHTKHKFLSLPYKILKKIIEWKDADEGSQAKHLAKRELKGLLSRKSSFTMLSRADKSVQQSLLPEFFD